ncbi:MAG TPA: RNA 2',3'-cyclic phosphodiesterase [Acidimicrobiia bacterium]|nr:RNA 2',3'-cyclic phosphodiesterase [Acidimicrobiia bacterium]
MGLTPTGRVFAAVVPPPEVVAALAHRLESVTLPGRPVPPANWHITLRFIGHVEEVAYERWLATMDQAPAPAPFDLALRGFGAFPRAARATVFWTGVESAGLPRLAAVVDDSAETAGLGQEERPFHPHLTLARVRPPADVRPLVESDDGWKARFTVAEYHVMAAVGSRYERYETFPL